MPLATRSIDKGRLADQIFNDLKDQIISGALQRGQKLPTEKELSELYSVSGPTVREAIRGLSVIGLIEVRQGSGAYVSANGEALVAMSLSAVMQLETVGVADALNIQKVLCVHAATCAVEKGTDADIRRLKETCAALGAAQNGEQAAAGVRAFHYALAKASHNALLEVICSFLTNIQVEFARIMTEGKIGAWQKMFSELHELRLRLVQAIERRDAKAAAKAAEEFHQHAIFQVTSLPKARQVSLKDPRLGSVVSSILSELEPHT
ncbi:MULTISPECIES: GntR family transcriptional regulator [unclassified Beijerinckia]|uniref:FadR/GntR family transcriptional regulator n=1 Tax=unclassified Beijerinckia TaxID=2638183 RepID=UPI000896FB0D|nr:MULTISPECIES: GntR family transcriptional regulator [unclassified Beijerinckia]MDH7794762.1 GntR family transcriptional repressor for pyruvate dehydrogenase complex [Beijerinckia sp. GAS462]SEB74231.1 transcriptional regulator, GntR family [Beijerinckia sp. 28-YEA-48]